MKKNTQGFILIIVLIFLVVLGAISIYLVEMAWIETKGARANFYKYKINELAEQALYSAENQVIQSDPSCLISVTDPIVLLNNSLNDWESSVACMGNLSSFQYYYVVEALGEDSCAYLEVDSQRRTAHYFRLTLMGIEGDMRVILQSTIVKPNDHDSGQCVTESHVVSAGRQMWRDLTDLIQTSTPAKPE